MPLGGAKRPDWKFLKFKYVLDDGTKQPTEAEYPWEAEKIRALLDQIATPGTFTEADKNYKYMVSEEKSTLAEVKELGNKVQKIIKSRNFPNSGIHQERHLMCSALFDELIRQVIIEHPDLGEILLRIRDHFQQEIYNYEQLYTASQAFGFRKQFMEKNDERLNELEAEAENLVKEQNRALEEVEKAYEENVKLIAEYNKIEVDEVEYWRAVKFFQKYINYLLYYFHLRADDQLIKGEFEEKEEDTEEEDKDKDEETDAFESFTMGDDKVEEEEEELPKVLEDDVKVTATKQQKEEPIDKDLIYRENEEEVFDSDVDTEQTVASELPKSQDDDTEITPPTETVPNEQIQMLLEEDLKNEISFTDMVRGYMKKPYEEELKAIEEEKRRKEKQKRLEEKRKRLESEVSKQKKSRRQFSDIKQIETGEELSEEGMEEEVEEEEILPQSEEIVSHEISKDRESLTVYPREICKAKIDTKISILEKPKYALLRRLVYNVKCKDLVQRISDAKPAKERKVKKVLVKKRKIRPKAPSLVEPIQQVPETGIAPDEESLTFVRPSDFKWGLPLIEYFKLIGRKVSVYPTRMSLETAADVQDKKEEDGTEDIAKVPKEDEAVPEEESSLYSSCPSIGRSESLQSTRQSKKDSSTDSISIGEEEERVVAKNEPDDLGEEEEDYPSV